MASSCKRICLRASPQWSFRPNPLLQWQANCPISTTASRPYAEEVQQNAEQSDTPSNAQLDALASQPGVKYTITEEYDDLQAAGSDSLTSLAHRELEQHKELREMVRIAAWEMPLLSQLARPFHPPDATQQPLRWRYTTYLGEPHPAARKVVVEFQPRSLRNLNYPQYVKLLKLVGPRYKPSTRTVRMSCESFETQAQNKRFLADTINKLIAEAQDEKADSFEDVPLDLRHHTPKQRHRFPRAWGMTPQRREELEGRRKTLLLEEGKRIEEDRLVSGAATLEAQMKRDTRKVEQPVMVAARSGKTERGQQRGRR